MKIWIYINGNRRGPYTLDEFVNLPIDRSTPVWYDGLPQWTRADLAPATAQLFADGSGCSDRVTVVTDPSGTSACSNAASVTDGHKCPPTYLALSIIITICCCTPGGLLAIFFAIMCRSKFSNGEFAAARRYSEYLQWTLMISMALGALWAPISALFL